MQAFKHFSLFIFIAFLVLLGVKPSLGQKQNQNWLEGTWEGRGVQTDGQSWDMKLTVTGDRYVIEYPSLRCQGVWDLVDLNAKKAKFVERITANSQTCIQTGDVSIEKVSDEQVKFSYSLRNATEIMARAVLQKSRVVIPTKTNLDANRNYSDRIESVRARRAPQSNVNPLINESDSENRYRNVGNKLSETDKYDLYEYVFYNPNEQCFNSPSSKKAWVVLVFKSADPDYVVSAENTDYKRIVENEIVPALMGKCNNLAEVLIWNYFRGVRVEQDSRSGARNHLKEYRTNEEFAGDREFSFIVKTFITPDGQISSRTDFAGVPTLSRVRENRKEILKSQERESAARADRLAEIARKAEERRARLATGVFSSKGLNNEEMFANIFLGDFDALPFKRDELSFGSLFGAYLKSFSEYCSSSLPRNKVELTAQECVTERVTRNGYGFEISRTCIESRTVGTGVFVDPAMYAAKSAIDRSQAAKILNPKSGGGLFGGVLEALVDLTNGTTLRETEKAIDLASDVAPLFRANTCSSPGLKRFQENLRRFALNEKPLQDSAYSEASPTIENKGPEKRPTPVQKPQSPTAKPRVKASKRTGLP